MAITRGTRKRLDTAKRRVQEHLDSDCALCQRSVFDVAAPACPILTELNNEVRERLETHGSVTIAARFLG